MQFLRLGRGRISEVRMSCPDHARNSINLVPAPVNAPRFIEHAVLSEDVIDCLSSACGVALAEYVVEIANQQGRDAVGHSWSPIVLGRLSGSSLALDWRLPRCVNREIRVALPCGGRGPVAHRRWFRQRPAILEPFNEIGVADEWPSE